MRKSPTVWSISLKSSSMVVNWIAFDGDDSDDGPGDGPRDGPRDGAVEAFVDTAASDDAESIGDAAMMLGFWVAEVSERRKTTRREWWWRERCGSICM
jgi:hypothetical protein